MRVLHHVDGVFVMPIAKFGSCGVVIKMGVFFRISEGSKVFVAGSLGGLNVIRNHECPPVPLRHCVKSGLTERLLGHCRGNLGFTRDLGGYVPDA